MLVLSYSFDQFFDKIFYEILTALRNRLFSYISICYI